MRLPFTKMHGCGNDYIFVNGWRFPLEDPGLLSKKLSSRRFGVGGDGLILTSPPKDPQNHAFMRIFNADGSEGKMCGNGVRCAARFFCENIALKPLPLLKIETLSGVKEVSANSPEEWTVAMGAPIFDWDEIPLSEDVGKGLVKRKFAGLEEEREIFCVSMGNPHCVIFVDDLNIDVEKIGGIIENDKLFPERVNAEFVKIHDKKSLELRVWERGSGETSSCGTGVCAAVVAASEVYGAAGDYVSVKTSGGGLYVLYDKNVYLRGEAVTVFNGEIEV